MQYKILKVILLTLFTSGLIYSQNLTVIVSEIKGIAYIEKKDRLNLQSVRAFRGSEIKDNYILRTDNNSQVVITVMQNNVKTSTILLYPSTAILVNKSLFSEKERTKSSISLLNGHIKVNAVNGTGSDTQIHTANSSTLVIGTDFEVAFAEDGSTVVLLNEGKVNVVSEDYSGILKPNETYTSKADGTTSIQNKSEANPSIIMKDSDYKVSSDKEAVLENLVKAMDGVKTSQNELSKEIVNADKEQNIQVLNEIEKKQHRLLTANEGYYLAITKIVEKESENSKKVLEYAKTGTALYNANNRSVERMNAALLRTQTKFEKAQKEFEEKLKEKSKTSTK